MKPDAPPAPLSQAARSPALSNREPSNPPSPAAPPPAPATRPKLNLAKRTVSEAQPEAAVTSAVDSKASPFGAAKPTDTAAREKAVEEKRQLVLREKKEAEEKAKAEKKAVDEKAREEKRLAKESEDAAKTQQVQSPREKPSHQRSDRPEKRERGDKENGASAPALGKQYEILRRTKVDDASAVSEEADEAEDGNQNGFIVSDKEVKPKEIVRDISSTNGETAQNPPESTTNELQEEGWETVPAKGRRRNGAVGARALAS